MRCFVLCKKKHLKSSWVAVGDCVFCVLLWLHTGVSGWTTPAHYLFLFLDPDEGSSREMPQALEFHAKMEVKD